MTCEEVPVPVRNRTRLDVQPVDPVLHQGHAERVAEETVLLGHIVPVGETSGSTDIRYLLQAF